MGEKTQEEKLLIYEKGNGLCKIKVTLKIEMAKKQRKIHLVYC